MTNVSVTLHWTQPSKPNGEWWWYGATTKTLNSSLRYRNDQWLQTVLHVQAGDGRGHCEGLLQGNRLSAEESRYDLMVILLYYSRKDGLPKSYNLH